MTNAGPTAFDGRAAVASIPRSFADQPPSADAEVVRLEVRGTLSPVEHVGPDMSDAEKRLASYLERDPHGCYAAYLFGSVARGSDRPTSDIDVGVLLDSGAPKTLAAFPSALQAELTELLGRPVDLVVLDGAPPDLIHRVLRDGRLVLDRERSRRIAFEVRARNEYFDLRPVLDLYRRRAEIPA